MRLMISGGGTGGGVYPALAVVQELKNLTHSGAPAWDEVDILWVGSEAGMEAPLVARAGIRFASIPAGGLRGQNPVATVKALRDLGLGYFESRRLVRQFQPDVLLVTGGYVCTAVTLAARWAGVPILIYLPDIEPGLAIRLLSHFADRIAVTTTESQAFFRPGLTLVSGYPARPALYQLDKAEARARLGLDPGAPVLLIFGGSRGARSINRAIVANLQAILAVAQVIHVSGQLDAAWTEAARAELGPEQRARYHLFSYLHEEMLDALAAADLVVSRAGASILGEYPALGLPAILVPYPHAGAHQALNAAYLVDRGAAVIVKDDELEDKLEGLILSLLSDKKRWAAMAAAAQTLAQPEAARKISRELICLARNEGGGAKS